MKKPLWSWVNTFGRLGYRVFRKPKQTPSLSENILQMEAENLEERQMLAADLSNFGLANDDGASSTDLITTDPTVTATVVGDYSDFSMGMTKVEFDHHGDGSVDGEEMLYYPDQVVTYDPISNEASLDTYTGPLNIRWRVYTTDYMGSEIYSTAWSDFNFEKGVADSPEIQVVDEGSVEVVSGAGVINFGNTEVNTPISRTFTIHNLGNADLTIDVNSFTIPNGFSLTTNPDATVTSNGSTTFTVQFDAATEGLASGTLTFMNNDFDEALYSFDLIANVATPQPDVEIRSFTGHHLVNGSGEVDFGSTIDGTPLQVRLAITNHGDADLTLDLNSITVPNGYSVHTDPSTTVSGAGGRTYITLQLDATTIGSYSGTFSIGTNDPDHATYSIDLTGEVTDEYTITIFGFGLLNDTGVQGDNSSYDPVVQGFVNGNFQGGSIKVQFDHDGNGNANGLVTITNPMDPFQYDPREFDSDFVNTMGAKALNYRFVRFDSSGNVEETGDWTTFNFNLEYDPSLGDVTIDHFGLAIDTGSNSEDKVTTSPRLSGIINGPLGNGYVVVEFDHVGDGTISGSTQVDDSGSVFIYDPRVTDPAIAAIVGGITINYRLVRYDENDVAQETGNWASFSFTQEALPTGELTVDDLGLVNDTINGTGTDTDNITYDPTLKGVATVPVDANGNSPNYAVPVLELDFDEDGVTDQESLLSLDGNGELSFEVVPEGITYGAIVVNARVRYWDSDLNEFLTGDWSSFSFTFEPKAAPDISDLSLKNDTIGPDGNGSEEDETENDTGTDGITKDPTITGQIDPETGDVAYVKVEFDYDGDGNVDHHGWANVDGSFDWIPENFAEGTHTVKARTAVYDALLDDDVKGAWTELTFTLEKVSPYSLDEFRLVNDTESDAGSATDDGITRDSRLTGQVGSGSELWGVTVEFDYDGDDEIDATTSTDYNGKFYFDPAGIGFGQKTVRARAVAVDAYSNEFVYSSWSSLTFTIDQPDHQAVYVTDLQLSESSVVDGTQSYNPVIEGRVMQPWFLPLGPSAAAEQLELSEGYGVDSAAAYQNVFFDLDGDQVVDETVQTDWDGRFYFAPTGLGVGTHTVHVKSQSWNYITEEYVDSGWVSHQFEVIAATDTAPQITSTEVMAGAGESNSDHSAVITGLISNGDSLEGVAVEFDEDGDGTMDGVAFTDAKGRFFYTTGPLAYGTTAVIATAVKWSHINGDYLAGTSVSIDVTLAEDLVNDAPVIVDLELSNNQGSPTTIDYTTSDPQFYGRVSNDGYLREIWIEIDLDDDGIANHTIETGDYGEFEFTAMGLDYGNLDVKFRASEIDYASGTRLLGTWETVSFELQEFVTSLANVTTFEISEDTLSSDGSGNNSDGITTNASVSGTIANDDGIAGLTVEIDLDDDGVVDVVTTTDDQGQFSYTPSDLDVGTHTIKVRTRQVDQNGDAQYSGWSSTTFTLEEPANENLHVNQLELNTDDGTVTDDFITTDPTIKGSIGGANAGEGIKVQIDTNGDGYFEAEVYTDANGEFTYTPEIKNLPDGVIDNINDIPGIEQGVNGISFRTVEEDTYGYQSYSAWNTISFVLHDDPDSAEAQSMKSARDQYDADMAAGRNTYRTALKNAHDDYRTNRQATKETLETALKNARDALKAGNQDAYQDFNLDMQAIWTTYFASVDGALATYAAAGGGIDYEFKDFFKSQFDEFALIDTTAPDFYSLPTPPSDKPNYDGLDHDFASDDLFQQAFMAAFEDYSAAMGAADAVKETDIGNANTNFQNSTQSTDNAYRAAQELAKKNYYENQPSYNWIAIAIHVAGEYKKIADIQAKLEVQKKQIEQWYLDGIYDLLIAYGMDPNNPNEMNDINVPLEIAMAELARDKELKINHVVSTAQTKIHTIQEGIVRYHAAQRYNFAAGNGKLGVYLQYQFDLATAKETWEIETALNHQTRANAYSAAIKKWKDSQAVARKDQVIALATAFRDAIQRRKDADPNPWWTYQLELAENALTYHTGKANEVLNNAQDHNLADHNHTLAITQATFDQNETIAKAKHDRSDAYNIAMNTYQNREVEEDYYREFDRSIAWEEMLIARTIAMLGEPATEGATEEEAAEDELKVDGFLDRLAQASFEKFSRDIVALKRHWDVLNSNATLPVIEESFRILEVDDAHSMYQYEVDYVDAKATHDQEITLAHKNQVNAAIEAQSVFLDWMAKEHTFYDIEIAEFDFGYEDANGDEVAGFYEVVAQANGTLAIERAKAERDWWIAAAQSDKDYSTAESVLYEDWTKADAQSLKDHKAHIDAMWHNAIANWNLALDTVWSNFILDNADAELARNSAFSLAELARTSAAAGALRTNESEYAAKYKDFIDGDVNANVTHTEQVVAAMIAAVQRDNAAYKKRDIDKSKKTELHDREIINGSPGEYQLGANTGYYNSINTHNKILTDSVDYAIWNYRKAVANADYLKVKDELSNEAHQALIDTAYEIMRDAIAEAELYRSNELIEDYYVMVNQHSNMHQILATEWQTIIDLFADEWQEGQDLLALDLKLINIATGSSYASIDETYEVGVSAADKDWFQAYEGASATLSGALSTATSDFTDGVFESIDDYSAERLQDLKDTHALATDSGSPSYQTKQGVALQIQTDSADARQAANGGRRAANKLNRDARNTATLNAFLANHNSVATANHNFVVADTGAFKDHSEGTNVAYNIYQESLTKASNAQTAARIKADNVYRIDVNQAAWDREVAIAQSWRTYVESMSLERVRLYKGEITQQEYDDIDLARLATFDKAKARHERVYLIDMAQAQLARVGAYGLAAIDAADAVKDAELALTNDINIQESNLSSNLKTSSTDMVSAVETAANTLTGSINAGAASYLSDEQSSLTTLAASLSNTAISEVTGLNTLQWDYLIGTATQEVSNWASFDNAVGNEQSGHGSSRSSGHLDYLNNYRSTHEAQALAAANDTKSYHQALTNLTNTFNQAGQAILTTLDASLGAEKLNYETDASDASGDLGISITSIDNSKHVALANADGLRLTNTVAAEAVKESALQQAEIDYLIAVNDLMNNSALSEEELNDALAIEHWNKLVTRAEAVKDFKISIAAIDKAWKDSITDANKAEEDSSSGAIAGWESTYADLTKAFTITANDLLNDQYKDSSAGEDQFKKDRSLLDRNRRDGHLGAFTLLDTGHHDANKTTMANLSNGGNSNASIDVAAWQADIAASINPDRITNQATRSTNDTQATTDYHDGVIATNLVFRDDVVAANVAKVGAIAGAKAAQQTGDAAAFSQLMSDMADAGTIYTKAVTEAQKTFLEKIALYEMRLALGSYVLGDGSAGDPYVEADFVADKASAAQTMHAEIETARKAYVSAYANAVNDYYSTTATNFKNEASNIDSANKTFADQSEDANATRADAEAHLFKTVLTTYANNRETANISDYISFGDAFDTATSSGSSPIQLLTAAMQSANATQGIGSEGLNNDLVQAINTNLKDFTNASIAAIKDYAKDMALHEKSLFDSLHSSYETSVHSAGSAFQTFAASGNYRTDMPVAPKASEVDMPSLLEEGITDFFDDFYRPAYHEEMFGVAEQEGSDGEYYWSPNPKNEFGHLTRKGPSPLMNQVQRKSGPEGGLGDYYTDISLNQDEANLVGDSGNGFENNTGNGNALLSGKSNNNVQQKLKTGKNGVGHGVTLGSVAGQGATVNNDYGKTYEADDDGDFKIPGLPGFSVESVDKLFAGIDGHARYTFDKYGYDYLDSAQRVALAKKLVAFSDSGGKITLTENEIQVIRLLMLDHVWPNLRTHGRISPEDQAKLDKLKDEIDIATGDFQLNWVTIASRGITYTVNLPFRALYSVAKDGHPIARHPAAFRNGVMEGFVIDGLIGTLNFAKDAVEKGWEALAQEFNPFYLGATPLEKAKAAWDRHGPTLKAVWKDSTEIALIFTSVFLATTDAPSMDIVYYGLSERINKSKTLDPLTKKVLQKFLVALPILLERLEKEWEGKSDKEKAELYGRLVGALLFEFALGFTISGLASIKKTGFSHKFLRQLDESHDLRAVLRDYHQKSSVDLLVPTSIPKIKCFSRDTLVSAENGLKPIGNIEVGERVYSFDFKKGDWELCTVTNRIDSLYEGPVITVGTGESKIETTVYHPFWVVDGRDLHERSVPRELKAGEDEEQSLDGRWVNSHELRVGDTLVDQDGNTRTVTAISQRFEEDFPVSNLTIGEHHNYAVGQLRLLVHNVSICDDAIIAYKKLLSEGLDSKSLFAKFSALAKKLNHTDKEIAQAWRYILDKTWKPGAGHIQNKAAQKRWADLPPSSRKTISEVDGEYLHSGYDPVPRAGYKHVTYQDVMDFGKKIGHEFADSNIRDKGIRGRAKASHAEKQAYLRNPNAIVHISKNMCSDCQEFFRKAAIYTKKEIWTMDLEYIRIFKPDGTVELLKLAK